MTGKVPRAPGYTVLTAPQAAARAQQIAALAVPTRGGADQGERPDPRGRGQGRPGLRRALRLRHRATGDRWTADDGPGTSSPPTARGSPQGWQVSVGFTNFTRVLTDPHISGHFIGTLLWNFVFAIGSVRGTFALGMAVALALHHAAACGAPASTGSR